MGGKQTVLEKGKPVVTPSTHSVSQPDAHRVLVYLGCEKLCCREHSRHVCYILCSMEEQEPTSIASSPERMGLGWGWGSQQQQQGKNVLDRLTLEGVCMCGKRRGVECILLTTAVCSELSHTRPPSSLIVL